MGLNIKNDETYRLVEELAKLTGEWGGHASRS
jgi:hypothetical protein